MTGQSLAGGEFLVGLYGIACPEGWLARAIEAVNLTERAVAVGVDVLWIGEGRDSLEDVFLDRVDEDVEAGKR